MCAYLVTSVVSVFVTPMDCSPLGSSIHGILQVRILEWAAMPSSSGFSLCLLPCWWILYPLSHLIFMCICV